MVVVWKLDRLSRSLKDPLHLVERLERAGAGLCSLTEALDMTTAAGRMMLAMAGAFAEFERAMMRERTRAGLAEAGRVGGRRPKPLGWEHINLTGDYVWGEDAIPFAAEGGGLCQLGPPRRP